jgi:hypothetical protein
MTPKLNTSQTALEQLADLTKTLEKEKVQLTPEVEEYVRSHVRAVQDKLQAGQDVYESDLAFIEKVKMWVKNIKESKERDISMDQWQDLLHVAEAAGKEKKWIDEAFTFSIEGKIEAEEDLNFSLCKKLTKLPDNLLADSDLKLMGCTGLTRLPDNLWVGKGLDLEGCKSLTQLPKGLQVRSYLFINDCTGLTNLPNDLWVGGGGLFLSENLNEQVKKDAKRLKSEGKIKGAIKYV